MSGAIHPHPMANPAPSPMPWLNGLGVGGGRSGAGDTVTGRLGSGDSPRVCAGVAPRIWQATQDMPGARRLLQMAQWIGVVMSMLTVKPLLRVR
jgi:hypothetical protein